MKRIKILALIGLIVILVSFSFQSTWKPYLIEDAPPDYFRAESEDTDLSMRYFPVDALFMSGIEVNDSILYGNGLNNNHTLKIGREEDTTYDAGFVFNVSGTVSQGDAVKYARIKFVSWGNVTQSSIMLNLTGADVDSIEGFDSVQRPSTYTRTENSTVWTPTETWELNDSAVYFDYYSPDISSVVNEILARPSWTGNIGLFIDDINTDTTSNNTLSANLSAVNLELYKTAKDTFLHKEFLSRPTNTSITVSLFSVMPTQSYVEYGTSPGTYTANTSILTVAADEPIEHLLTGLQPDTTYFYRVRARKNGTSDSYEMFDEYNFTTARSEGSSFTFDVITDSHLMKIHIKRYYNKELSAQDNIDKINNVLNLVKKDDPDFVIDLGDLIMTQIAGQAWAKHNKSAQWRTSVARSYIENISTNISIFNSWDNHDMQVGFDIPGSGYTSELRSWSDDAKYKYFHNPNSTWNEFGGAPEENYYAFEWGDALIVVIDANRYTTTKPTSPENWTLGTTQLEWLNNTLKNSTKPWKFILAGHIVGGDEFKCDTLYCYGDGGAAYAGIGEQAQIQQMMEDNGVQFFIHGHSHLFSNATNNTVTYITIGPVGENPATIGYYRYDYIYANESPIDESGYARIRVSSDNVNVEFINASDGSVLRTISESSG